MENKLVAVVGMCGSGKSVVTDEFKQQGYKVLHFGDITMEKVKEFGLDINEVNEKMVREKLRKDYGMQAYAILNLNKIRDYLMTNNVVIDGLYSWSEYKILVSEFPKIHVLAVVANKEIRYSRLAERGIRPLTVTEAEARDIAEIEHIEKGGPIAYADAFILNNSSAEQLRQEVQQYIIDLGKI